MKWFILATITVVNDLPSRSPARKIFLDNSQTVMMELCSTASRFGLFRSYQLESGETLAHRIEAVSALLSSFVDLVNCHYEHWEHLLASEAEFKPDQETQNSYNTLSCSVRSLTDSMNTATGDYFWAKSDSAKPHALLGVFIAALFSYQSELGALAVIEKHHQAASFFVN